MDGQRNTLNCIDINCRLVENTLKITFWSVIICYSWNKDNDHKAHNLICLLIYLRETVEIGIFALRKCVKCTKGLTGTKGLIGRYTCRCNKLYW